MNTPGDLAGEERDGRRRAADAAPHSSQLEGATASAGFRTDVDEYVEGHIDTDELRRRIRARHLTAVPA